MKKIAYIFAFLISINLLILNVYAFVDTTKEEKSPGEMLHVVTFKDYMPFGAVRGAGINTRIDGIIMPEFQKFMENKNYNVTELDKLSPDYMTNVRAVRSGKIDILIGTYSLTKLYNGIELIYPALINNPVNVAMMPEKIDQVSTLEDLRGMKGVRLKGEIFNDYVEGILKRFQVEETDTLYQAYEKLFIGEVDYVIGGYYNLLAEAIRIGVRPYVSFSKKSLWDIPVFIGVSKASRVNKKLLIKLLTAWANTESVRENIKQNLRDYIENLEIKYDVVVPPMFIRQDDAPTAAGIVSGAENVAQDITTEVSEQLEPQEEMQDTTTENKKGEN